MHIPFTKDRCLQQEQHVVTLEDHTDRTEEEDAAARLPSSTTLQNRLSNSLTQHLHPANVPHQALNLPDGVVDVLYENQRGSFLCGIPLFSAAGLWITDPHAWVGIDNRYSPFTIFNATLPDPTWEWVWKRWFVDMSGDVDENGWSYNLTFTRHHWHGHHIWYHSFVRRRRWLRKRRKVSGSIRATRREKNPAEDYFTIASSTRLGVQISGVADFNLEEDEQAGDVHDVKLENLGDFYQRLRNARLDREKLDAVDNFLTNGKELDALAGEMRHILRFMIFQESRRQLLVLLARRCQEIEKQHDVTKAGASRKPRHQCVQDAIEMAEVMIDSLDYFSDRIQASKEEEDAELDRLQSAQNQPVSSLHTSSEPNKQPKSANYEIPSLQETADAALSAKAPNGPDKRDRKTVVFEDESKHQSINPKSERSGVYSAEEKGKEREH